MVTVPSRETEAFLRDLSRRMVLVLSPESKAFPRDLSRRKAGGGLPSRRVDLLAVVLREVHLAVGI
jgi:hypothetical protein